MAAKMGRHLFQFFAPPAAGRANSWMIRRGEESLSDESLEIVHPFTL
jgi:hypothetical protein